MKEKKTPKPRGGAHNVKSPAERRVSLFVMVSPETKEALKPYAAQSKTGRIIDEAVREYLANHPIN